MTLHKLFILALCALPVYQIVYFQKKMLELSVEYFIHKYLIFPAIGFTTVLLQKNSSNNTKLKIEKRCNASF